jgi:hypothetical protein
MSHRSALIPDLYFYSFTVPRTECFIVPLLYNLKFCDFNLKTSNMREM